MNIVSNKKTLAFLVTTLITSNLLACTNADNRNNTARQDLNRTQNALDNRDQDNRGGENIDHYNTNQNSMYQNNMNQGNRNQDNTTLTRRADKIAEELTKIKGVRSANVLISNERALVGIDMDKNLEGKDTTKLKTDVENKVKRIDSKIKTVAVSSDADTLQRIGNIGEGINAGRPLSEFGKEIEELFRRILPQ